MAGAIVDSGEIVVAGQTATFRLTLTKDGAAYDLTGKTVRCTFRRESAPGTVLAPSLEDVAMNVSDPVNGVAEVTQELEPGHFTTPAPVERTTPYLVQSYVLQDDFYPQALRFHVRRALD